MRGLFRGAERVTAAGADGPGLDAELRPANRADWSGRELRHGVAAKIARGRKKSATQTIDWTSEHANHSAPARGLRQGKVGDADGGVFREDAPRFGAKTEPDKTEPIGPDAKSIAHRRNSG